MRWDAYTDCWKFNAFGGTMCVNPPTKRIILEDPSRSDSLATRQILSCDVHLAQYLVGLRWPRVTVAIYRKKT